MRLIDWQLAFERHLLADADEGGFASTLIGGPTLDVDTGLAIYHNAYRARLLEVMQGDFPTVWHWLGDDEFAGLVAAYVQRYPSAHSACAGWGSGLRVLSASTWLPHKVHRWPSWHAWNGRLPWRLMRLRASRWPWKTWLGWHPRPGHCCRSSGDRRCSRCCAASTACRSGVRSRRRQRFPAALRCSRPRYA